MAEDDVKTSEIAELSFEEALKELETIVRRLEGGEVKLEEAISDYERGVALKTHCESKLREARSKVEKIVTGSDGAPDVEPVEGD